MYIIWCLFCLSKFSDSQISGSLFSTDAPPDCCLVHEIRLARYSSIHTIYAKNVLVADFLQRKKAAASFPLWITNKSSQNAIAQFLSHINTMITDTNDVCTFCGLLIVFGISSLLTRLHSEFVSAIKKDYNRLIPEYYYYEA